MARADKQSAKPHNALGRAIDRQVVAGVNGGVVRIGFVPLIDAAPLIAARELGFFERHGVRVALERQIGWANVRDKLTYGHLDAGHALLGIPLASVLGGNWVGESLVTVMELGAGGNAITLSKALVDRGVRSAASLARWIHDNRLSVGPRSTDVERDDAKLVLAHVFGSSTHHYLLREWLSSAGIQPDIDVRLCVIPPPQMAEHLAQRHLDGFCVGEPWNSIAEENGDGVVVTPTTDILPNHPEKVLAVRRKWATEHGPAVVSIITAVLEACAWCEATENHAELAAMLSAEKYIGVEAGVIARSLQLDRSFGITARQTSPRPVDWEMRSFSLERTFPNASHAAWLAEQMIRWGHLSSSVDVLEAARECTDARFYRQAAAERGIAQPADDFAPMPLRHGSQYDARKTPYRGQQQLHPEAVPAMAGV